MDTLLDTRITYLDRAGPILAFPAQVPFCAKSSQVHGNLVTAISRYMYLLCVWNTTDRQIRFRRPYVTVLGKLYYLHFYTYGVRVIIIRANKYRVILCYVFRLGLFVTIAISQSPTNCSMVPKNL